MRVKECGAERRGAVRIESERSKEGLDGLDQLDRGIARRRGRARGTDGLMFLLMRVVRTAGMLRNVRSVRSAECADGMVGDQRPPRTSSRLGAVHFQRAPRRGEFKPVPRQPACREAKGARPQPHPDREEGRGAELPRLTRFLRRVSAAQLNMLPPSTSPSTFPPSRAESRPTHCASTTGVASAGPGMGVGTAEWMCRNGD